jgi:RNA polymerase sigma-70 factor (ECF subfamily)
MHGRPLEPLVLVRRAVLTWKAMPTAKLKALPDPTPSQPFLVDRRARALSIERAIIERVLDGDVAAYRRLVERHQRRVYAIAFRMVGNFSDADDVAQQAFVAAFDALDGFDRALPFGSWINRIAINLAKDHLKSKKRTEVSLPDEPVPAEAAHLAGKLPNPEDEAVRGELRGRLQRALDALSCRDREVLVLKDIEELSYEEMRGILQRPITALKIRVIRARRKLRAALERLGSEHGKAS